MEDTKLKIERIVSDYERLFVEEFQNFKDQMITKKDRMTEKFGVIMKGDDFITRVLYEVPETLDFCIKQALAEDEMSWLQTKTAARWFARRFPEFALPDKI